MDLNLNPDGAAQNHTKQWLEAFARGHAKLCIFYTLDGN